MDTSSYWIDTAPLPRFPKLDRDVTADVVVIGGGIMGLTSALLLKRAGLKVVLLERERCARIDTGHTTAHVTAVTDLRLHEIAREYSKDHAKAVWDAGGAAIDQIVNLIRGHDIACDFKWIPGYLHAPLKEASDDDVKNLEREAELARELGIAAEFTPSVPFIELPGVKFAHQALFHPRKYLAAIAQAIPGDGSHIFENTEAGEVQEKPLSVKVDNFKVTCGYVVLATHTPLMGRTGVLKATLFQSKLFLYSTYAIGAKVPSGKIPEGSYWDTSDPYYYLRVDKHRDHDYAIFGGEDHKTGQETDTTAPYRRLEEQFLQLVRDAVIDHRWSGQVIETNDGLPFIGETAEKQFAATGFAGNGMTFGTLSAMMALDAVLKRKNPWAELFDIHRAKIVGGTWSYVSENSDYPYYMVRDRMARAEAKSVRALKPGEGKILNVDGKKVAGYRDEKGEVTLCSPVCTHLKCIVGWNEAEKTWDCPCHGSRFKPTGEVISGPAEEPLEKIKP
jgi:glycine/D-amino acid oxidase-like deaminating enzyme/nitrite reductase/ring-hydroxylating ferredoxin subunit